MDNILEQCNGTIKDGMCTKCFDRARNTSAICTKLYNPDPSPSQVLTAEEVLKKCLLKWCPEKECPDFEKDWKDRVDNDVFKAINEAIQEYSTLQTQQLQNRVKELEEQLSVMPTRKHQIVSEVVELREQVKQARNEAIQECLDDLPMESNPENPGNFNEGYNWCLQLVTRMLAIKRNQAEMKTKQ